MKSYFIALNIPPSDEDAYLRMRVRVTAGHRRPRRFAKVPGPELMLVRIYLIKRDRRDSPVGNTTSHTHAAHTRTHTQTHTFTHAHTRRIDVFYTDACVCVCVHGRCANNENVLKPRRRVSRGAQSTALFSPRRRRRDRNYIRVL